MEIEREGATIFELDDDGGNRWEAFVMSTRLNSSECAKIARTLQAAPDLLKALRSILGNASNHATRSPEAWADAFRGLANTANAAIAKAEGR